MSTPNFAKGLKRLRPEAAAPSPAPVEAPPASVSTAAQPSRVGKVAIAAYFDPEVRKQLALISVHSDTTQAALIGEALNMLFEKYGYPPIA